ncbi:antibiotic biosynthesis monooxygenase [Mycobacterium sp.]|uniref:antibiotic biosynthesis monooxygenase n=1 Tax=Mycobacterium sp. TaxID=1785 RepID=UPI002D3EDA98|nr:antibiotic biosynthesis monooxygenase [Mycobacterium sp.]HZA09472.1 antibiotic biosynthesis monooxygenase [Mycobacterium sp.]
MPAENATDTETTVIIGQRVRPGFERDFSRWQHRLNDIASRYPGFIAAEVTEPTATQPDWVVVYRFDTIANVQAWINSAARQEWMTQGQQYFDGPATQQIVSGGGKPADMLVTVVVTHRVRPEDVDDFLAWQERLRTVESKFGGFRGSELFRPIPGVQDDWTVLYRYDTVADLDKWLTSKERQQLLDEGKKFSDFQLRTVDNSFGSWFSFDDHGVPAPQPSNTKSAIAVWVGLYPTVVLLTLALSPLKLPLWLAMLVGNLLSSSVMTFVTMPYYVNPLLKQWLWPRADAPKARTNLRGIALVAAVMVAWTVVIYLITTVFWHLP